MASDQSPVLWFGTGSGEFTIGFIKQAKALLYNIYAMQSLLCRGNPVRPKRCPHRVSIWLAVPFDVAQSRAGFRC